MAVTEGVSLESLLNRATNPMNKDEDWEYIMAFCDQVNKELEGPQIAVRLLSHKIQSPQEKEAIYALVTLESCVKNCGKRFHQEIGKFRFLNEIIKVVSPKYLGNHTTEAVKTHCIEMLYSWSTGLKEERKIEEAYQMLKKQGIVVTDPVHVDRTFEATPPVRAKNTVFEDDEKSKMLARLLRSKHPEDLQAANRLIKNMVKQDAERIEKVSKRVTDLETVGNNIKLLTEMLMVYAPDTGEADKDIMKELYDNLEKQRPNLFRLASDTDDKDSEGITSILKVNDEVVKVMATYRRLVEGSTDENGLMLGLSDTKPTTKTTDSGEAQPSNMDTLEDLFGTNTTKDTNQAASDTLLNLTLNNTSSTVAHNVGASGLMDQQPVMDSLDQILSSNSAEQSLTTMPSHSLFTSPITAANTTLQGIDSIDSNAIPTMTPARMSNLHSLSTGIPEVSSGAGFTLPSNHLSQSLSTSLTANVQQIPLQSQNQPSTLQPQAVNNIIPESITIPWDGSTEVKKISQNNQPLTSAFDDLDILGKSLSTESAKAKTQPPSKVSLNQMTMTPVCTSGLTPSSATVTPNVTPAKAMTPVPPLGTPAVSSNVTPAKAVSTPVQPLTNVFVKLEDIKPGSVAPINAFDKDGLKIVMHIARDKPREDVLVIVLSVLSNNPDPIKQLSFQAAVPKVMKVKLQPPSATDLPGYNPILPPAAITQVMLIANPAKEKIRLKFKLTYKVNDQTKTDVGEVDTFPL